MAALTLTVETYQEKIHGGWQGKSAGVTFGAGQRGQLTPGRNNYYSPVPGQPNASIALDFPLVWLATLEQTGPEVAPEDLAVAWLEHLDYVQDEFGYAALNLRRGLPPPASGAHSNWFRHGTGGVMRADLWAMLAPGAPQVAAAYAYHDAKLDHCEDGVWAAMFLAAMGSAAFFLKDTLTLLTIGLAMIPRTCRTARAVKTALAAGQRGASWLEARESVQHEVGHPNFTDVPQNIGFLVLGLLYGAGDFGASLCAAVNCGYDAEIVGGMAGAILGIQRGRSGLPEDWVKPIGDLVIPGIGMRDFEAPLTLTEVAARTLAVGQRIVAARCTDVAIGEAETVAATPDLSASVPATGEVPALEVPAPGIPAEGPDLSAATPAPPSPPAESEPALPSTASPTPMEAVPAAPSLTTSESALPAAADRPPSVVPAPPVAAMPEEPAAPLSGGPTGEAAPPEGTPPLVGLPQGVARAPEVVSQAAQEESAGTAAETDAAAPPSGAFAPQPVSREAPAVAQESSAGTPEDSAVASAPAAPVAPDLAGAIAWADSTRVKPLLIIPPNALVSQAGPFEVIMDTGDSPTVAFNATKTLAFSVFNHGADAFSGRITLLAPPGWQVTGPPNLGQRQYIAANTGTFRADFTLRVVDGQGRIDIANAVTLRLAPDDGTPPQEAEFVLLGASCWWTVGPFANFDGEGFDRSYLPEDRPGLQESYLSRSQQNIRWERQIYPESTLDLEPLFKGSSGVCYGQTILRSPTARDVRLVANTNSGVKVWLNGALVLRRFHREVFRPVLGSGPWAVDVSLRAGDNPVMVKWVRGSEPYAFSLTVSDRYGRGLPEVGNVSW